MLTGLLVLIVASMAAGYGLSLLPGQAVTGSDVQKARLTTTPLPKDIYPDSLNRLPKINRDELDEVGKKLYDSMDRVPVVNREELDEAGKKLYDSSGGDTRSHGPTAIWLYSPPLGEHLSKANDYIRHIYGLDPRVSELTILIAAREMDNRYLWSSHEPAGLKAGLEQKTIDVVKYRKPLTGLEEKEAALIQLGREVLGQHKVKSDTFARNLKIFGKQGLVNVVSLMGLYATNSILLNTFDQQVPPGRTALLPIP